ncbi:YlbE-like family protein [Alteribacillus sp. HJP-4]|uniref:YlbE-like family protein n=1 Tax=Alteribacillus sp. HJP-4 TaxID=2775394 RepID=UPI0035CCD006
MHAHIFQNIQNKPEYRSYLRLHPVWYRRLNKHPEDLPAFINEAKQYHGLTIPQRIERWQKNAEMAMMLLQLMKN